MMPAKRPYQLLVIFVIGFLLCSCASSVKHESLVQERKTSHSLGGGLTAGGALGATTSLGNPGGLVVGSLVGGYLNSESRLLEKLRAHDVKIIKIGDTISFLLPVDNFFAPKEDRMSYEHYPTLDLIVRILNKYGNAAIKIAVSTDDIDTFTRNRLLARRQAERITAYLWKKGIDAWRLYPIAYGARNLLATNRTVQGSYANRVIEITFNPYVTPADCCQHIRHFMGKKQEWQYWGLPY